MNIFTVRGTGFSASQKTVGQNAQKPAEPRFGLMATLDDLLDAGAEQQHRFHDEQNRVFEGERLRKLAAGETRYRACREQVLDLLDNSTFQKQGACGQAPLSGWDLVIEVLAHDYKDRVIETLTPESQPPAKALIQTLSRHGVLTRILEMEQEYWSRDFMVWPDAVVNTCKLGKLGTHQLNLSTRTFD